MCGISGIISKRGKIQSDEEIRIMNDRISHRGPDGEGLYLFENLALGHKRLAILDLSELGHQPMHFEQKYTIVFNGEVYNYIEIREELLAKGYKFNSETDTEVILAAYDFWGEQCVHKFNGMWSFAILDKAKNTLFCSRDRFGIKPFYYCETPNQFCFGSEIKQLISKNPVANQSVILDYIVTGLEETTNETFFLGILKLPGGHNLFYDLALHEYRIESYYTIPFKSEKEKSEDIAITSYGTALQESVKLRMRSDVKVGTCLSGGLDSSAVAAVASKNYHSSLKFNAIHAKSEEKSTDESSYAELVAKHLDLNLIVTEPSVNDFVSLVDEVFESQEEPFGSPSVFMQYFVFREARKNNCLVMLDGQGGDETLMGYERYYPAIVRSLPISKKMGAILKSKQNSRLSIFQSIAYMFYFGNYAIRIRKLKKKAHFVKREFLKDYKSDVLKRISESYSNINDLQNTELRVTQLPHLLRYEDKNSMKHSVEARLPFLDYRVVEVAMNLDHNFKIKDGWTKYVLRKVVDKMLPSEVVWRKNKFGFNAPENLWLKHYFDTMQSVIHESKILENLLNFNELNLKKLDRRAQWRLFSVAKWEAIYDVTFTKSTI